MTTTIRHVTLKSLGKDKGIDPSKGTVTNPFTQEEYNKLCHTGTWSGGYVEAMGYVAPPMMDGMDDGSGSSGSSPYDNILNTILQSLPSALSNLITSGQIAVVFDPLLEVPGRYYTATSTIRINSDNIDMYTIRHELIHAYEHKQGFVDGQSHTNNEFETYVMNDIFNYISIQGVGFASVTVLADHALSSDYNSLIANCINHDTWKVNANYFTANVGQYFNAFLECHTGTPAGDGTTNANYPWHWTALLTAFGLV